ncbi:hypothetical protein AB0M02_32975 [Actinoplanes sp. NPDC051861]|uniref:nucleotidyltransferase domain-containing protein n=1 Tax=Actinoplanes sp. NPDC051861 TaxID=3155170 RepID=UPI003426A94A
MSMETACDEVSELEALERRWARCWAPGEVARRLAGAEVPWYVAAGWALDLFRGGQSRTHHDIEVGVPAGRFAEIRSRFPGLVFDAVGDGRIREAASAEDLAETHQTWLRDPATGDYLLDVFREPHDGPTWICRRDPSLRLPYASIIHHTPDGIPYLIPELVLLFKAKATRPKDQADFEGVLPLLSAAQRSALAGWLTRVHPAHAWLAALDS